MRGVPAALQTRHDYDRVRAMAADPDSGLPHQDRVRAIGHWQWLLTSRYQWEFDRELETESDADAGDDYRTIAQRDDETNEVTGYLQERRVERDRAPIKRLGLSVAEVEQAITDMEAVTHG